jgi:hypothetical protein
VYVQDELASIDLRVIRPGLRGTWANVVLQHALLERLAAGGVTRYRFQANLDRHVETLHLARRLQADTIETHVSLARTLDGKTGTEPSTTEQR